MVNQSIQIPCRCARNGIWHHYWNAGVACKTTGGGGRTVFRKSFGFSAEQNINEWKVLKAEMSKVLKVVIQRHQPAAFFIFWLWFHFPAYREWSKIRLSRNIAAGNQLKSFGWSIPRYLYKDDSVLLWVAFFLPHQGMQWHPPQSSGVVQVSAIGRKGEFWRRSTPNVFCYPSLQCIPETFTKGAFHKRSAFGKFCKMHHVKTAFSNILQTMQLPFGIFFPLKWW